MQDPSSVIWFDGQWVPWAAATTHVLTHSLHYGVAVIEGLRAYPDVRGGASVFRLAAHLDRFFGSARIYRMELPFSAAELARAHLDVVRENELPEAYLRPIAFYGAEKLGVSPRGARVHVAIAAFPWPAYLGEDALERGLRVRTSSFQRTRPNTSLGRAKISASYANSMLARMEAAEDGYDEALLLDSEGLVAEGPGENLFLVRDGRLHEPEPTSALLGITRDTVHALARGLGLRVETRRLTRDDVYLADEAFFTGTAAEIAPIVELDRRRIGDGRPGATTRALAAAYRAAVTGRTPALHHWLTRTDGGPG